MQNERVNTVRHARVLLRGIHFSYTRTNRINHKAPAHNHLTIFHKYPLKIFTWNAFVSIHFAVPINNLPVKQQPTPMHRLLQSVHTNHSVQFQYITQRNWRIINKQGMNKLSLLILNLHFPIYAHLNHSIRQISCHLSSRWVLTWAAGLDLPLP